MTRTMDTYHDFSAYEHVNTKCLPCQSGGQGTVAMCHPASDRIKHGWPAVWLTVRKHTAIGQWPLAPSVAALVHVIHTEAFH